MLKQRSNAHGIVLPSLSPRNAVSRRSVLQEAPPRSFNLAQLRSRRAQWPTSSQRERWFSAWHTNIAARWLDPQQHDGTASPDNFLMALHDGLIKNFRDERYDHLALAEKYEFAEDAKSATFGSNTLTEPVGYT